MALTPELLDDKSLVRLVRRNWIKIWSLKSIIDVLANPNKTLSFFQFGKSPAQDLLFVSQLRSTLPEKYVEILSINDYSNERLIRDLASINDGLVSGGPVLEVHKKCPKKECRKVFKKKDQKCPEPIIKNIVKLITVDVCEGNKIECVTNLEYLPKECNLQTCLDITTEYCNGILRSMESEWEIFSNSNFLVDLWRACRSTTQRQSEGAFLESLGVSLRWLPAGGRLLLTRRFRTRRSETS